MHSKIQRGRVYLLAVLMLAVKCSLEDYSPSLPQSTLIVHGQLLVTRSPTPLPAALLSTWVTYSVYWYIGLFLPRCWTLHFYLLNSMRFLSAHLLSLSRSFYMAAWPGFTCFSYLVNPALNRCSLSDRSSAAAQTNFSQSQQVSKTLDNIASPYRLYHTKLFNTSFLQEKLWASTLPQTCKEPRSLWIPSEIDLFQFSPCK